VNPKKFQFSSEKQEIRKPELVVKVQYDEKDFAKVKRKIFECNQKLSDLNDQMIKV